MGSSFSLCTCTNFKPKINIKKSKENNTTKKRARSTSNPSAYILSPLDKGITLEDIFNTEFNGISLIVNKDDKIVSINRSTGYDLFLFHDIVVGLSIADLMITDTLNVGKQIYKLIASVRHDGQSRGFILTHDDTEYVIACFPLGNSKQTMYIQKSPISTTHLIKDLF